MTQAEAELILPRQARDERLKMLRSRARDLAKIVKRGETQYEQTLRNVHAEIEKLADLNAAEDDVAVFAYRYFSDEQNPENGAENIIRNVAPDVPHEAIDEVAPIHADMYDMINKSVRSKRGGQYVIASPRGHAKTQIVAVINTLHALCYRRKRYALLLSETDSLSKKIVASIANQLKYNAKLRADFGELLHVEKLRNRKDSDEHFITTNGVLVEASSSGKQLRGKTHNGHRPDLIICDDLSSLNNEATENLRNQLREWFNTVVEPLGDESSDLFFIGTMVTQSGLLSHILSRKDFKRTFHKAIINEPKNKQLWADWENLYISEDDQRPADEFYEANRDAMEEGVLLAWPRRWTYLELMEIKINRGRRAFASEYMNESMADDEAVFKPDDYTYYRQPYPSRPNILEYDGKYVDVNKMRIVGAWDTALAGTHRSAQNAFVTIAKDDETGRMFVLDVLATHDQPREFIPQILQRIADYDHEIIFTEGIGAYREFGEQLADTARRNGFLTTQFKNITTHGRANKAGRIEELAPMFYNKSLILSEKHPQLIEQLRGYTGKKRATELVDILDALVMAASHVYKRKKLKPMAKPAGF
ncbi:putative phage terminase large subunit-like protein [Alkalibacillus flavidus]|uniref:Phage terminase large subunit-like protein n=1 Tax=Alkalibacillus flavidus TaxID=546021 RepID=A0ABV2KVM5_9BACI